MTVEIDDEGAQEVLTQMARQHIDELARQVAKGAGEDAIVHTFTTDRAAASISVPAEQQAKHGVLTRAAAEAGLEVRSL
jgi:DNA-binding sugar fermentation-stimulating protein